ncbi:Glutathione S-transferase-like protein ustS [Mycena venus]|uniref:Glutathione S-transferase-like protein ustS n=1 Tax=Mycena venus TaxID=2733690 RepID=A0A8H7CXH9_9AGAR|nr:Glutathione S-transferase-like protein ustS [Mycena venus]
MSNAIIFYDIPSTLPHKAWSANTWKARLALNYKGIPYNTVWLEYPEIEPLSKKLGALPTRNKPDGSPLYTLPLIHDLSTGTVLSDSDKIAVYLDATYPDTPRLMPTGTVGMHFAFEDAVLALLFPLWRYLNTPTHAILNPASEAYFRTVQEATFGMKVEEMNPIGDVDAREWQKVKDSFGRMDSWIRANGQGIKYFMGDSHCYADLWLSAYLVSVKLVLPEKWEEMKLWHDGRWARLSESVAKYETVR